MTDFQEFQDASGRAIDAGCQLVKFAQLMQGLIRLPGLARRKLGQGPSYLVELPGDVLMDALPDVRLELGFPDERGKHAEPVRRRDTGFMFPGYYAGRPVLSPGTR